MRYNDQGYLAAVTSLERSLGTYMAEEALHKALQTPLPPPNIEEELHFAEEIDTTVKRGCFGDFGGLDSIPEEEDWVEDVECSGDSNSRY